MFEHRLCREKRLVASAASIACPNSNTIPVNFEPANWPIILYPPPKAWPSHADPWFESLGLVNLVPADVKSQFPPAGPYSGLSAAVHREALR